MVSAKDKVTHSYQTALSACENLMKELNAKTLEIGTVLYMISIIRAPDKNEWGLLRFNSYRTRLILISKCA